MIPEVEELKLLHNHLKESKKLLKKHNIQLDHQLMNNKINWATIEFLEVYLNKILTGVIP